MNLVSVANPRSVSPSLPVPPIEVAIGSVNLTLGFKRGTSST